MKIPENFKQKYQLKGDHYPSANADAALSELFAVSGRLYKENADLKAEVAALREAAENAAPASVSAEVDLSGIEALIASLSEQIASIRTTVNDTLCVVNDAAISAKKAEDSAKEAKAASDSANACAEDVKAKAQEILDAIGELGDKIDGAPSDVLPMIFANELADKKEVEILGMIADPIVPFSAMRDDEPLPEEDEEIAAAEEEEILSEVAAVEEFEDKPEEAAAPEESAQEAEEITEEADAEVIEEADEEVTEEADEEMTEDEPAKEEPAIADDLIRSAGLDSEPEEIEPAEPVDESDLSARLAKMYAETEDEELPIVKREEEELPPEPEKHAPTSFTDMKSALDAIRARLKK